MSARDLGGCYVGACFIPVMITAFRVTPAGEDELEVCGCTSIATLPCPWAGRVQRRGPRRFAGHPNASDPNNYQIWDFNDAGNCFCGKGEKENPVWGACRVCR